MNIFNKPLWLFVFSILLAQELHAQEGISVYSDYLTDNYYLLHPSMAGASNKAKIRLTARQQWAGVDNPPGLQTLSFNSKVGEKSGIGAILFNDRNGYHSEKGAKLTYAHHLSFSRNYFDLNQLSFGISAGMMQTVLDETTFTREPFDPTITGGLEVKDVSFNVDAGASYHYLDFYAHFTVKNLLNVKSDIYSDRETNNRRRYLFSLGYVFGNNYDRYGRANGFSWEPSMMLQYVEATKETFVDANIKMYKDFSNGQFFAGLSYRTGVDGATYTTNSSGPKKQFYNALSPILGVRYKNLMVGYTYTHVIGGVAFDKIGFHQLTLGFNLFHRDREYRCNCPSVNF